MEIAHVELGLAIVRVSREALLIQCHRAPAVRFGLIWRQEIGEILLHERDVPLRFRRGRARDHMAPTDSPHAVRRCLSWRYSFLSAVRQTLRGILSYLWPEALMMKQIVVGALVATVMVATASGQTRKPAAARSVTYDVTVQADTLYTGKMELAVAGGKVTGTMHITVPTEVTGKVAGTSKDGAMTLEFPYRMVARQCDGTISMNITLPAKPGPASGTVSVMGCGRDASNKLGGTIDLKPVPAK